MSACVVVISMAEGVFDATIVCCFMSPGYEASDNCKLELQHAQRHKKRIIPCMAVNRKVWKPSPRKWLDLITGSILAIDFSDASELNLQASIRELIQRILKQHSTSEVESTVPSMQIFEKIRQNYLKKNAVTRAVTEETLSIEESYINLAIVETKEQHEKEKKLKEQNQQIQEDSEQDNGSKQMTTNLLSTYEEIYGVKTSIQVENIFDKCKDQIKKVLVFGRAGIGKSTFCQYVTYRWAKGEIWSQYELVILIYLRNLTDSKYKSGKDYSPVDIVQEEHSLSEGLSNESRHWFEKQCKDGQILWVLDGYDEFVQNIPKKLKPMFDYIYGTQHHILTSRPYAVSIVYDVKMEITGFTNENIPKFIEHFFNGIKNEMKDALLRSEKLLRFLESNPGIWGVAHIPVNLELICSLWANTASSKESMLTITRLYDNITEWLCRRYLKRKDKGEEINSNLTPYKRCDMELQFLERLAFKAMESSQIMLPPELLVETEYELNCSLDNYPHLLNMGILKSYDDRPINDKIEANKQHYFVHLTFQEHFAARHLLRTLNNSNKQEPIDFINNNKYNQRFHFVFVFASGLLAKPDYKSCMDLFWKTIQEEPLDLVGIKHIKLIIECIDQILDITVFRNRAEYLVPILRWIEIYFVRESNPITDSLLESFQRTNSIINNSAVQKKFFDLLTTRDNIGKFHLLRHLSQLTISNHTPKLVSAISKELKNGEKSVQREACEFLGKMSYKAVTKETITTLINALEDKDYSLQSTAEKALIKFGKESPTQEVIVGLLNVLQLQDKSIKSRACEILGEIGAKAATNEVIAALMIAIRDPDWNVRNKSSRALREVLRQASKHEPSPALVEALHDEQAFVREEAYAVLLSMNEIAATDSIVTTLVKASQDEKPSIRCEACKALGQIRKGKSGNEVIRALLIALGDEDRTVRGTACRALGEASGNAPIREVVTALLNAANDEDRYVRDSVHDAFKIIAEKAATSETIAVLNDALHHKDGFMQCAAAQALRQLAECTATDEMINAL
ncbi:unnamed protein product, partial [Rotaria sp. Silwood1]